MSTPAVAQRALDDAQTAALIGMDSEILKILYAERWYGVRKDY